MLQGSAEWQPPPPTRPLRFGKQGDSNPQSVTKGGTWGRGQGGIRPPIGGSQRAERSGTSDWPPSLFVRRLTALVPTGHASRLRAPPLLGRCPPRAAERMRMRPHAAAEPARRTTHPGSQWVSREPRRSSGRRGGGSMAASLRLRGAASGLQYWSRRQPPAVANLAAGKDLAPPSPVPPPVARFSLPDRRRGFFHRRRCD